MSPFLFVALDGLVKKESQTLGIANRLLKVDGSFGFKVNQDYLVISEAFQTLIKELNRPFFADLKMFNGRRTMISTVEKLVALGVDFLSVYALADELLPEVIEVTKGTKTKVLGVTVLTHFDDDYCRKHFRRSLEETVEHFAKVDVDAGCHGVILPGTTLSVISNLDTIKATPGIRPKWYRDIRHKESVEPSYAIANGANILICGSPIMKSPDPVEALKKVLSEME